MNKSFAYRILIDAVMAVAVLSGWWYVALLLGIIGLWVFPYYFELVVAGLFFDALFGSGRGFGIVGCLGLIISFGISLVFWALRSTIRR